MTEASGVTLVDAPGQQGAGQAADPDGSQGLNLSFTYERWEPTLQQGS